MKNKWIPLLMTFFLSLSLLTGCNTGDSENEGNPNNDNNEQQDDSGKQPKQYDEDTDTNDINEDNIRDNEPTENDGGSETDMELQKGSNGEFDKNRGPQ